MKNGIFTQFIKPAFWAVVFLECFTAQAQVSIPGIDTSFNHTGYAWLHEITDFVPQEQAVQVDGKILAAGYGHNNDAEDLDGIVYRVNPDGSLDQSFGENGALRIDIDGAHDAIEAIKVLPDNKILILLESTFRTIFIKLLPDGQYDTSFGNDGVMLGNLGTNEFCLDMEIQADQKIVVVGSKLVSGTKYKGVVRRYNADGSVDETYGTNGLVYVVIDPTKNLELYDCVLQPDGKLLATGTFGSLAGSGFPVIRLNTDGSFDSDFSGDGIYFNLMGNASYSAESHSIAVNDAGTIFVGGASPNGSTDMLTILSVKPTGVINSGFGNFGVARIPINLYSYANSILFQPDGKLLIGGYAYTTSTTTSLALVRLTASGALDNTFGQQGKFISHINNGYDVQAISDINLSPDGRLISLAWLNETINLGTANNTASAYVLRYLTDITIKATEPSAIFVEAGLSPNPVCNNEQVTVRYYLENTCSVTLSLYDINGRELSILRSAEQRTPGEQNEQINLPDNLPAGTYFVLLSTEAGYKALKILKP